MKNITTLIQAVIEAANVNTKDSFDTKGKVVAAIALEANVLKKPAIVKAAIRESFELSNYGKVRISRDGYISGISYRHGLRVNLGSVAETLQIFELKSDGHIFDYDLQMVTFTDLRVAAEKVLKA